MGMQELSAHRAGFLLFCGLFYFILHRRFQRDGRLNVFLSMFALLLPLPVGIILVEALFPLSAAEILHTVASAPSLTTPIGLMDVVAKLQVFIQRSPCGFALLLGLTYVTAQTFCLPGTSLINGIFGALYGTTHALLISLTTATLGASMCYIFSKMVGVRVVNAVDRLFMKGNGVCRLRALVEANPHSTQLWLCLLSARISPLIPNWFLNLSVPVLGVAFVPFVVTTAIGLIPQTYLVVRGGNILLAIGNHALSTKQVQGPISFISPTESIALMFLAVVLLAPSIVTKLYNVMRFYRRRSEGKAVGSKEKQ